jgi:hypothetical protein
LAIHLLNKYDAVSVNESSNSEIANDTATALPSTEVLLLLLLGDKVVDDEEAPLLAPPLLSGVVMPSRLVESTG